MYPPFLPVQISVFLILADQLIFIDLPRNRGLVDLYSVLYGRDLHSSRSCTDQDEQHPLHRYLGILKTT